MILAKNIGGSIPYIIAGQAAPPASIASTLYGLDSSVLATGTATVPTSGTPSAITTRVDEGDVTITVSGWSPPAAGAVVRVIDAWGHIEDCLCDGSSAGSVRVCEYGGEVATKPQKVWAPTVAIPVSGAYLTECGEGYRVEIACTYTGGTVIRDTVWFAVAPYSSQLAISPREYIDHHPEAGNHLMTVQRRRDWPRLIATACAMVEAELRSMELWYSSLITGSDHARAVAAAVNRLLAPTLCPANMSADPQGWLQDADRKYTEAIRLLRANARHDATGDGPATADQLPPARTAYRVL
jgi:hypothetical protein